MRVRDILIFIGLSIAGVLMALNFEQIPLPEWLRDTIKQFKSELSVSSGALPGEAKIPSSIPDSITSAASHLFSGTAGESIPQYFCRKKAGKAVEEVSGPQIYKWVDAQGKTHFSDKPPAQQASQTLTVEGRKKYFNLQLHADTKGFPPHFRDRLTVRVNKAYSVLTQLIPEDQLQQVDVNLWVFNSRSAYDSFYSKHATGVASTSQGFHSSRNNIAAALRKTDKQVLMTGVHEAVHVMNAGMFGRLPRWLNEGMAEYLEGIKVYGQSADIAVREDWLRKIRQSRLSLESLLRAGNQQWQGDQRNNLYAHSWAAVYFLMSSQEGKDVLSRYLMAAAKSPCVEVNARTFMQRHYSGGMVNLDRRFNAWLMGRKSNHHI
jgi:Domain of unknown function (DUF4124)/Protein of unknown function (DUF1570)